MPKPKPAEAQKDEREIRRHADNLLAEIRTRQILMADKEAEMQGRIENVRAGYERELVIYRELIASADMALMQIMKMERKTLFAETDVVNLPNGSLIRNQGWKVTIPRDALGKCEEHGFDDVIKIAKSLDRDTVEKWENWKLELIGAERKPATKYSYETKIPRVGP
jgi:hypothetical protein